MIRSEVSTQDEACEDLTLDTVAVKRASALSSSKRGKLD